MLGPGAQLRRTHPRAATEEYWPRDFLWSRAESIFSGANEIQRNIIAKRVLNLPQG
ncbi:MAG TPA: acyl-CoA dehydrogenase family protein [Candidatus Binatia bacterium]|nr:acyl-CoA dehydrogenase family protein [Candidatus Binatia bacterium]